MGSASSACNRQSSAVISPIDAEAIAANGFINKTTKSEKMTPAQTARALALIEQCMTDFDLLFDNGFEQLGKSQNEIIRQVQQVVFLRGTVRLHSQLRFLFAKKTNAFFELQLAHIYRGNIADWHAIGQAHRERLAKMKPAKRLVTPTPFHVVLSDSNGAIFNRINSFLSKRDRRTYSLVSKQCLAEMNTDLSWRATGMLAWIGSAYLLWYESHMEIILETLRYLDQQHSIRDKKSHIEFLDHGQTSIKMKIDEILPLKEDERFYWRQQIFGPTLSAKQTLSRLYESPFFQPILSEHFVRFTKYGL